MRMQIRGEIGRKATVTNVRKDATEICPDLSKVAPWSGVVPGSEVVSVDSDRLATVPGDIR